jgi:hypothetical protein
VRLALSYSLAMKTIGLMLVLALVGCGNKGSAGACSDAIGKALDTMMAGNLKRMEGMGDQGSAMKAAMGEMTTKLKGVLVNRCTEDKWSAEIIDCTAKASSRDELKACQAKLPPEQAAKLQTEIIEVMRSGMGGMGMGRPHGMGSGMSPPPSGSDTTAPPPSGSAAGSAQ